MTDNISRIGIKYNPQFSIKRVDIRKFIDIFKTKENIDIIDFLDDLFIIFKRKQDDIEIKIRNDGIVVIYMIYDGPIEYQNIRQAYTKILSKSEEILNYLRIHDIATTYKFKPTIDLIFHELESTNKVDNKTLTNNIIQIFGIKDKNELYARNESIILFDLNQTSFL